MRQQGHAAASNSVREICERGCHPLAAICPFGSLRVSDSSTEIYLPNIDGAMSVSHPLAVIPGCRTRSRNRYGSLIVDFAESGNSANDPVAAVLQCD